MTTKKIILILAIVVIVIGLLVVTVVGGIAGLVFYSISNSEAATVAKDFLRNNEKLKQDIGEVKDFGFFVTGSINTDQSGGAATLNFRVDGERKTVNASVQLTSQRGQWRVTHASYVNDAGQKIDLLNVFEARTLFSTPFPFHKVLQANSLT
jgi:hypothetical protein